MLFDTGLLGRPSGKYLKTYNFLKNCWREKFSFHFEAQDNRALNPAENNFSLILLIFRQMIFCFHWVGSKFEQKGLELLKKEELFDWHKNF